MILDIMEANDECSQVIMGYEDGLCSEECIILHWRNDCIDNLLEDGDDADDDDDDEGGGHYEYIELRKRRQPYEDGSIRALK